MNRAEKEGEKDKARFQERQVQKTEFEGKQSCSSLLTLRVNKLSSPLLNQRSGVRFEPKLDQLLSNNAAGSAGLSKA